MPETWSNQKDSFGGGGPAPPRSCPTRTRYPKAYLEALALVATQKKESRPSSGRNALRRRPEFMSPSKNQLLPQFAKLPSNAASSPFVRSSLRTTYPMYSRFRYLSSLNQVSPLSVVVK